ncbi:MAG: hypothetical protein ABW022_04930, partial [Actinoplanes sp.]
MPLIVWLLLVAVGTGLLLWQQNDSRHSVAQRYDTGVRVLGDFMAGVAAQQLAGGSVQAQAALADPVVEPRDFERVVSSFGFSGAIPVRASPLAAYFTTALSLTDARVQLVDTGGNIVAATETFNTANPALAAQDAPLAAALSNDADGRYEAGGEWWRYSSMPVDGTPWRLSATVR